MSNILWHRKPVRGLGLSEVLDVNAAGEQVCIDVKRQLVTIEADSTGKYHVGSFQGASFAVDQFYGRAFERCQLIHHVYHKQTVWDGFGKVERHWCIEPEDWVTIMLGVEVFTQQAVVGFLRKRIAVTNPAFR